MAKSKLVECGMSTSWWQVSQNRGFVQSKAYECVFYKGKTILLLYADDAILCGPSSKVINDIIASWLLNKSMGRWIVFDGQLLMLFSKANKSCMFLVSGLFGMNATWTQYHVLA
jgi:hypothetical protein